MSPAPWLGLAAALGLVVVAEIAAPPPQDPAPTPPLRAADVAAARTAPTIMAEQAPRWVARALGRPLFSLDRRSPRPPAGAGATVSDARVRLPRLAGIIMDARGGVAIFAPAAGGDKPLAVAKGGTLSAWTVLDIAPREVRLSGPGGESTLHVAFELAGEAVPPATVSPGLRNMPINPRLVHQRHGNEAE